MSGLQVGNPRLLTCVGVMEGGSPLEKELHEWFAEHHLRGEWFMPSSALVTYIKDNASVPTALYKVK